MAMVVDESSITVGNLVLNSFQVARSLDRLFAQVEKLVPPYGSREHFGLGDLSYAAILRAVFLSIKSLQ